MLVDPQAQPDAQGWGISLIISGEIQKSSAPDPDIDRRGDRSVGIGLR